MPFRLGIVEVILVLVIIFIIFGAGKLPQVGQDCGVSNLEFLVEGRGQ